MSSGPPAHVRFAWQHRVSAQPYASWIARVSRATQHDDLLRDPQDAEPLSERSTVAEGGPPAGSSQFFDCFVRICPRAAENSLPHVRSDAGGVSPEPLPNGGR